MAKPGSWLFRRHPHRCRRRMLMRMTPAMNPATKKHRVKTAQKRAVMTVQMILPARADLTKKVLAAAAVLTARAVPLHQARPVRVLHALKGPAHQVLPAHRVTVRAAKAAAVRAVDKASVADNTPFRFCSLESICLSYFSSQPTRGERSRSRSSNSGG